MLETDEKQKDYSLKAKCLLEQLPLIVVRSQARPIPQYTLGRKEFLSFPWNGLVCFGTRRSVIFTVQ